MICSPLFRLETIKRELLERAALTAICACLYYELLDCIDIIPDAELENIIDGNYDCPACGKKGAVR